MSDTVVPKNKDTMAISNNCENVSEMFFFMTSWFCGSGPCQHSFLKNKSVTLAMSQKKVEEESVSKTLQDVTLDCSSYNPEDDN